MRKTAGPQSHVILSRMRRIPERCSRRRQSPVILSHRRRIPERCSRRRQSPVILSRRRRISERRCVVPFRDPSAHSAPLRFEKRKIARFPRVPSLLRMTRFFGAPGTSPRTGTKKDSPFAEDPRCIGRYPSLISFSRNWIVSMLPRVFGYFAASASTVTLPVGRYHENCLKYVVYVLVSLNR